MESTIYKSIRTSFVLLLVVNFLLHTKLANVANVIKENKQTNILMVLESRRAHREGAFKCVGETQLTMTLQNNREYKVSLMK